MLGRAPRGARRGGWAGRGGTWAATRFFADFELLPVAAGRPGEYDDWGRVCAPLRPGISPSPRAQPGPNPALGEAGPPSGGFRIAGRAEAGSVLALSVAIRPTTQALKHASSAPMSSVLGWAWRAQKGVGKFWRSHILRSAVPNVISPLHTHQARLGNAHGRARARCSRCSAGNVVMWEPRAAWWRAGRARARGSTRHRWQAPRGIKCARVRRRGQRAGASPAAACKPFASRRPCDD